MNQTIRRLNIEDDPRCIEYLEITGKGVKYRLLKDYFTYTDIFVPEDVELGCVGLYSDGLLHISTGYEWNGANVIKDTDSVMRASLGHDAFCELVSAGLIPKSEMKKINDNFMNDCQEDGASKIRYTIHRFFLKKHWQGWFS